MKISETTPVRRRTRPLRWVLGLGLGAALALGSCKTTKGDTEVPDLGPPKPTQPEPTAAPAKVWPKPPPPTAPKPVNFPDVASFRLANDLVVFIVENHEVPLVSAQLVVRCGGMDHEYLADFTANMLGEGTKSRTKAKLDEAIESVGGSLFAWGGTHVSTVQARSLSSDLKLAMLLMADEVQNPVFPPASLSKLQTTAKAALRMSRADPDRLADTLLAMQIYPDGHPYGRPLPTAEEIDAITVDDLRKFHQTYYRANNSFLLLSGDITEAEAKPLVERAFGKWPKAPVESLPPNPLNEFTRYELPAELVVHLVDRPESAQASIRVGNLAIARNHEDWPALTVANQILGAGPTSRLFQDLREERGLTYRIRSGVDDGQAPGMFSISTQTRTPTAGAMLAGIFEHIERIRMADPPQAEFDTTVRTLIGSFPLQVETADQIVDKLRDQIIYGLPKNYWAGYRDAITRVDVAQVRKAALRYVHAMPVVVVVGNAEEIRPQIAQVLPTAKIVEYGDDLKPRG